MPLGNVGSGFHNLFFRSRDANGTWSQTQRQIFYVTPITDISPPSSLVDLEYFVDTDPGYGQGTNIPISGGANATNVNFTVGLGALPVGFHTLFYRSKDANGSWSQTQSRIFYVDSGITANIPNLDKAEYYFDTDPGYGSATNIPVATPGTDLPDLNLLADASALPDGPHRLFVRVRNADGQWSQILSRSFTKSGCSSSENLAANRPNPSSYTGNGLTAAAVEAIFNGAPVTGGSSTFFNNYFIQADLGTALRPLSEVQLSLLNPNSAVVNYTLQIQTSTNLSTWTTVDSYQALLPASQTAPLLVTRPLTAGQNNVRGLRLVLLLPTIPQGIQMSNAGVFYFNCSGPTITGFTPAGGPAGTVVTITGTNLSGATAVTFNGVAAGPITNNTATSLTVAAPVGGASGQICVTTPAGVACSAQSYNYPAAIATGTISPSTPCGGQTISVPFSANTADFGAGNAFKFQLSDADGNFAADAPLLGTLVTSNASGGTLSGAIPLATPAGTGYRVRVVASVPATVGTANTVNLTINTTPVSQAAGPVTVANGSPINLTIAPDYAGATYSWTGPNNFTSTQQNPTIASATNPGVNRFTVTVTLGSCTYSSFVDVNVQPSTDAILTLTPFAGPLCVATPRNLAFEVTGNAFPAGNVLTAQLSDVSGSFAAPVNIGTVNFSGIGNGSVTVALPRATEAGSGYRIRLVASNPTTIVSNTNGSDLTVNALPVVTVSSNSPVRADGTLQLQGGPAATGNTYAWTFIAANGNTSGVISNQQNPQVTNAQPAQSGRYRLALTNAAGCTDTASTLVTITPTEPVTTLMLQSINQAVCAGNGLTLSFTVAGPGFTTATTISAVLSDVNGVFSASSPIIGSASIITATAETLFVAIPPSTPTGANYRIRLESDSNPVVTSNEVGASITNLTTASAGSNSPVAAGSTLTLTATGISGATYQWTGPNGYAATGPNQTISGATVANAGSYQVTISLNGCSKTVSTTVIVNTINRLDQTISFGPLASKTYGDAPFTLVATASSGLPVSFSVSSVPSGVASLSGDTITILGAGEVTVTALQAGNSTYNPASSSETIKIDKAGQTIAFGPVPDKIFGDDPFALSAQASSGLPVNFSVLSGNGLITNGNQLTFTGAGNITVQASQPGNNNFLPAASQQRTLCVSAGQPGTITGGSAVCQGSQQYSVPAVAGVEYTWTVSGGAVISSSGNAATVDWTSPGSFLLTVTASGNCGEATTRSISVSVTESLAPDIATSLLPVNGTLGLSLPLNLSWKPSVNAESYDLYIWPASEPVPPSVPFANNLTSINYTVTKGLDFGILYNWRVVAKNKCNSSESLVQRFALRQLPDLLVYDLQVPESAIAGTPIGVRWKVSNTGAGSTQSQTWTDEVYLSTDTILDFSSDVLLGRAQNVSFLQPGQIYKGEANFVIPVSVFGQYYVFVTSNRGSLLESEKANNTVRSEARIPVTVIPLADVRPVSAAIPATAFGNDFVTVTYRFKNEGNASIINKNWTDQIWISPDSNFVATEARLLGSNPVGPLILPKDSSYTRAFRAKIPHSLYGNFYVHVLANAGRSFEEISRENNVATTRSMNVKLRPPADLAVTNVAVPPAVFSGQPLEISWNVQNQGANDPVEAAWTDHLYISKAPVFDIKTAVLLGKTVYSKSNPLLPDAMYSQRASYTIPEGLSGNYYVYVLTDGDSTVFEYIYDDNNLTRSRQPVTVNYAYADLAGVQGQTDLDSVGVREILTVSWVTGNIGPNTAFASWTDAIYLSKDKVLSRDDIPLGEFSNASDIISGSRISNTAKVLMKGVYAGEYFLLVRIDSKNRVFENDPAGKDLKSNNVFALPKPVYVKGLGVADLTVKKFTIESQPFSGKPVTLSWQVANVGSALTVLKQGYWSDNVYLSADSVLHPTDTLLKSYFNDKEVGPGEEYLNSISVRLPDDKFGKYYLILQAAIDSLNANDFNSANNLKAIPVTIALTDPADLVVEALSVPRQLIAGQQLHLPYTVRNQGKGVAQSALWSDKFYISTTPGIASGSLLIGRRERTAGLAANAAYRDSVQVNIPPGYSGVYYIVAVVDGGNVVYEHLAEENNSYAAVVEIQSPTPTDLIITETEVPATVGLGDDLQAAYIIKNAGAGRGVGTLKNGLYFSSPNNTVLNGAVDKLMGVDLGYVDLAPGQSITRSLQTKVKDINPGEYRGIAGTDLLNHIVETNEDNNGKAAGNTTSITISTLVLEVEKTVLLDKGDLLYYKIDVADDLDLVLNLTSNQPEGQNKVFIAYDRVPTLSDFDHQNTNTISTNQQVLVPSTKAGTYYVLIQTETKFSKPQQVKILARALPLSILGITPKKVGQGRVTCTLTGARFTPETKVYLKRPGGERVAQASVVQFTNSMQMRIRWQLDSVAVGLYDVTAVNGGIEVNLSPGIEVEPALAYQVGIQEQVPSLIRLGGSGHFSFRMENISNVDIPHSYVFIDVPAGTKINNYIVDVKSITTSRIEYSIDSTEVNDWEEDDDVLFTSTIVKDLSPGEIFTANFNATPSQAGNFETSITGLAFSRIGLVNRLVYEIEELRRLLSNEPSILDENLILLIQKPEEFRNAILQIYVKAGIISSEEVEEGGYRLAQNLNFSNVFLASLGNNSSIIYSEKSSLDACYCDKVKIECLVPALIKFGATYPATVGRIMISGLARFIEKQTRKLIKREIRRRRNGETSICDDLWACRNVPISGQGWGMFAKNARRADQVFEDEGSGGGGGSPDPCNPNPPQTPPPNSTQTYPTRVIRASDPNDITGPKGYGPQRFVSGRNTMPYTIRFENDPKLATTAAQLVTIVLPLDEQLNPLSVRVGSFGFSNFTFQVPDNIANYTRVLDLPDSLKYDVEVSAGVDIVNKTVNWTFQTIDPATGLPPADPLAGFLPVNDSTGRGEGFVTYSVKPLANVQTGDSITAQATIVFDIEEPISTNVWQNVADAKPPVTTVQSLPVISAENVIPVRFSGADDESGSGISSYALYFAADEAPYRLFGEFGKDSVALFKGEPGVKYQFISVGIDNAGNEEAMKEAPEAGTTIPAGNRAPVFRINGRTIVNSAVVACVNSTVTQCINVVDPEQDAITYSLIDIPESLKAALSSTGVGFCLDLTAESDYTGNDSLQVKACDDYGNCTTLTFKITTGPAVSLNAFSSISISASAFPLTGGSPAGGTFSGPGVSNGTFSPAAAGVGTHTITYTYSDAGGCTGTATRPITVNPAPTTDSVVYRLNAGGGALITSAGSFSADQYYSPNPGNIYSTGNAIAGTTDDDLYQSERYGSFTYTLPVPNGHYLVKLHFAEIYWNAPGQRVFDVMAEGTHMLQAYDIVQKVGPLTATTESFAVTVNDGVLSLAFVPGAGGVDQPKVSAIEVLSGGSALSASTARSVARPLAAVASVKLPGYSAQVKLYPNPSPDGRYSIELPAVFQGEVSYTLVSSMGTTLSQGQRTVSGAGQPITFDFSQQLAAEGIYYLHLRGAKGQAHVKLLRK
ncbi:CARDB domain-containing protein [Hymenobacter volaticus]|uniref:Malectin domain-containing carbohydrate-binding protein n=1 Tax=Hymenobacter volaticus TaxID=2932254 RepID=A0ABY4GEE1_9BACT|nr:CARDB domain-containing protein [Hymenobacter volaticus]UOQ69176.1 malectin domain-containing carbohydrate-binding protein [Hymenobacter volaticus]